MSGSNQLPRVLGYVTATAIVIGTVIGSGVFKKASAVSSNLSESGLALAAWVLVGILTLLGALTLAEVAVIVGKAGGNYPILRDAYGRWAGFLFGWVEFWIIRSASIAALATVFTESLHDILRQMHPQGPNVDVLSPGMLTAMTATVIGVLAIVNARGTKIGAGLQLAVTIGQSGLVDYDRALTVHRLRPGDVAGGQTASPLVSIPFGRQPGAE